MAAPTRGLAVADYSETWRDVARSFIASERYRSRPSVWAVRSELVRQGCPPAAAKMYALEAVEAADDV